MTERVMAVEFPAWTVALPADAASAKSTPELTEPQLATSAAASTEPRPVARL